MCSGLLLSYPRQFALLRLTIFTFRTTYSSVYYPYISTSQHHDHSFFPPSFPLRSCLYPLTPYPSESYSFTRTDRSFLPQVKCAYINSTTISHNPPTNRHSSTIPDPATTLNGVDLGGIRNGGVADAAITSPKRRSPYTWLPLTSSVVRTRAWIRLVSRLWAVKLISVMFSSFSGGAQTDDAGVVA